MSYLGSLGIEPAGPPLVVFHDVIDEETPGEIEMCIPIAAPIANEGEVVGRELAGGPVATVVHRGPYGEMVHRDFRGSPRGASVSILDAIRVENRHRSVEKR